MVLYQVSLHNEAVTLTKAPSHFKKSIGTMKVHLTDAFGEKDPQHDRECVTQNMKEPG